MRNVNCNVLSAPDTTSQNGIQIDSNQLISASFHCYFGDATAAGTFKLQASNDIAGSRNMTPIDGFTVTHWVDIPNQSVAIVAGASALLSLSDFAYRWLRVVYTSTSGGSTTITVNMDATSA